jgi:hypothetical protein
MDAAFVFFRVLCFSRHIDDAKAREAGRPVASRGGALERGDEGELGRDKSVGVGFSDRRHGSA